MRQASLKLKMYVNNASNISIINNDIEKIMLRAILWSFGTFAFLYVLFLGNMVSNIIERRQLEIDARVLSKEVGNLELAYLSISNNVDLVFSHSMGFKETKIIFATRKSLGFRSTDKSVDSIKILQNDI